MLKIFQMWMKVFLSFHLGGKCLYRFEKKVLVLHQKLLALKMRLDLFYSLTTNEPQNPEWFWRNPIKMDI